MSQLTDDALDEIVAQGLAWNKEFLDRWEARGVHVTPAHFSSPIPSLSELTEDLWARPSDLPGINIRDSAQLAFLETVCSRFRDEYAQFPLEPTPIPHHYFYNQMYFRAGDAEVLHCMVRHLRPRRLLEVGSGYSTFISAAAGLRNAGEGQPLRLTAIDPYPNDVLRSGFPGLADLWTQRAQDIPLTEFTALGDDDILFIDSSHVAKIGSDVLFLFLEVLPRLRKGVVVHIHDIFLPFEYPRDWITNHRRFWTEQYLLQAFLIQNVYFEVVWAGSYMRLRHSDALERVFPYYSSARHWPGSFWIRKLA